jgi:uncharacterized membrane-anchored protein
MTETAPHPLLTCDPSRFALANELHARPFPELTAPCRAIFLAIQPENAEERDLATDQARLIGLLERYGADHPGPNAAHYYGKLGRGWLKWESHTEFVTYTLFMPGVSDEPFSGASLSTFPADWLDNLGGRIISAALVRIELATDRAAAEAVFYDRLAPHFAPESLATGFVADEEALIASDFRLHEDGCARIAVIAAGAIEPSRLGRIVQRVIEIESYKTFALTALPVARATAARVTDLERQLSALTSDVAHGRGDPREVLESLTKLAAEVEQLATETAFRFGASAAYASIVEDRIAILREQRIRGRQLYSEFMKRRFDPAMRTCKAAELRLNALSDRVARASALLSTRVDVALEAQNQTILARMDQRAEAQMRLQQTVEGLSVVAISYYALNLGTYLLYPAAKAVELEKSTLTALLTPVVIGIVWLMIRRIRKHV